VSFVANFELRDFMEGSSNMSLKYGKNFLDFTGTHLEQCEILDSFGFNNKLCEVTHRRRFCTF
jgi:hypothetical protein